MKLNIQLFGSRGASSSRANSPKQINGVQVVKSTEGWRYWNIGENAPKGYIGLLKPNPNGGRGETAYFKTEYADEIAKYRGDSKYAMNYDTIRVLEGQISRTQKALDKVKQEPWQNASDIRIRRERLERRLEALKHVRDIRKKLDL